MAQFRNFFFSRVNAGFAEVCLRKSPNSLVTTKMCSSASIADRSDSSYLKLRKADESKMLREGLLDFFIIYNE